MRTQCSTSAVFASAQNVLITGGTFVSNNWTQVTAENYVVNNFFVNTGEAQMKIPVPQKPNSSLLFTGRKGVLDKLGMIFVDCMNNRPRRSCLLWGMGGIGKTQICLKFTEEMSDR